MSDVAAVAPLPVEEKPHKLDELMLAMDVVDTLRHQDNLVARELDDDHREAELLERLRNIYKTQGIDVPDSVIREGVKALRESRFVYSSPRPSWRLTLAKAWVYRERVGKWAGAALVALGLAWGAHYVTVTRPANIAAESARLEIEVALPKALASAEAEVLAEAKVDVARQRAAILAADAKAALGRRDAVAARKSIADLAALATELKRDYVVRVISRPREPSGVWRVPPGNRLGRNYYLVVEAFATAENTVLKLPITNEEDGHTEIVDRWGVRVSEAVFDQVRRDKADDGIIQRNRVGDKKRGQLAVDYAIPVEGGTITKW